MHTQPRHVRHIHSHRGEMLGQLLLLLAVMALIAIGVLVYVSG